MRMIQTPKIIVNKYPNSVTNEWHPKSYRLTDIWPDKVMFDSDRLENDPHDNFKYLSIGDFDLYTATAFIFASNEHPEYVKTDVECNRLTRHFRMQMIGLRDGMSYTESRKTGNIAEIESLFNVLDYSFGLIDECKMTEEDFGHTKYKIEDMLSYAYRVHSTKAYHQIYEPKIGIEVASIDVAMVLRKMLIKPSSVYDNWIRSLRGRRSFISREHSELFV